MRHALEQATAAGVEQLLDHLRVKQGVAGGQGIAQQSGDKARAGAVVGIQVALVDPVVQLFLAGHIGLQAAAIDWIVTPGRVGEARVLRVDLERLVAHQHAAQLTAQRGDMPGAVNGLLDSLQGQAAQGG